MSFAWPKLKAASGGSRHHYRAGLSFGNRLSSAAPGWVRFLAGTTIALMTSQFLWHFMQAEEAVLSPRPPAEPKLLANELQTRHLFGVGVMSDAKAAGIADNLKLIGTVAGEGIALVTVDGRPPRTFHIGMELSPGVRLISVESRKIEIERQGVREPLLIPAARSPVR